MGLVFPYRSRSFQCIAGQRSHCPGRQRAAFPAGSFVCHQAQFSCPVGSSFPGAADGHGPVPEPVQALLVSAVTCFCNLLPEKRRETTALGVMKAWDGLMPMGRHLRGLGSQSSEVCGLCQCHPCCFPDLLPYPWIDVGLGGLPTELRMRSPAPDVPEEEDTLHKAKET